ncbi:MULTISPECIES: hypothetical protein [Enterobacterales]|jgi:hypothetical protein|uniref:Uncharacterized protein n=6 Tax=Morganellaceae TaxID=1903414 RepID=A0A899NGX7_PROST|nr:MULTISPECIES: hypothetical protein [Enterobacterales]URQ57582.1 Hypothetical protein [Providencia alcalifaciens]EKH6496348.1 hypothetical protein [Providencia rettgeri]ELB1110296.1 hypothetical protein [Morganella morganii]ELL8907299.1 hypothetical protein [Proteus mirabilis]ELQ1457873.1 hypothetical protein [Providencia rettgeri]
MTEREQFAKDNAMSMDFVNWFFDNKKDSCGNVWFMMAAAMWEGWKGRASREAQAVQVTERMALDFHHALTDGSIGNDELEEIKVGLRAALCNVAVPPAPAVPDAVDYSDLDTTSQDREVIEAIAECKGWNAYRTALLAQPVSSCYTLADDARRMNWLVAHHVAVRKPLRYGSEAMFTAQTITDEEDDHHATKLREQIDAAMKAEAVKVQK